KGGKVKKQEKEKEFERETSRAANRANQEQVIAPPMDVPRELSKLVSLAVEEGSLQSLLILVKTLLCALDPSGSSQPSQDKGGVNEAHKVSGAGRPGRGSGEIVAEAQWSLAAQECALPVKPLRTLGSSSISGWPEFMSLLRREQHKEKMVALRGQPSITVCSGKADIRGRLEVRGESAGIVTGAPIPLTLRRRWYFEAVLTGASRGTRVGWAICGGKFSRGDVASGAGQALGCGQDSW
ncbi:unnamed protein product, partial [Discosporangium mesarthrocarpum]